MNRVPNLHTRLALIERFHCPYVMDDEVVCYRLASVDTFAVHGRIMVVGLFVMEHWFMVNN